MGLFDAVFGKKDAKNDPKNINELIANYCEIQRRIQNNSYSPFHNPEYDKLEKDLIDQINRMDDSPRSHQLLSVLQNSKGPIYDNVQAAVYSKLNPDGPTDLVGDMIADLTNGKATTRFNAACSLENYSKDPRVIEPLIKALTTDEEYTVRYRSAISLGAIRDPRAVEPLLKATGDTSIQVRDYVGDALSSFPDPDITDRIIKLLDDKNRDAREGAARALKKREDPRALEPMIKHLDDPDDQIRIQLILALSKFQDPRCTEHILKFCEDKNWQVRKYTAIALGNSKDPRIVEPLMRMIEDSNEDVRSSSIDALGKLQDPRAIEPLQKFIKDDSMFIREGAQKAIESIHRAQSTRT